VTNFNPDILWQSILFFSGLGLITGLTAMVTASICLKLFRKKFVVIKLFGLAYLFIVGFSLVLLVIDFFIVESRYVVINSILFLAFALYFSHFAATANKGGAILSRLIKSPPP